MSAPDYANEMSRGPTPQLWLSLLALVALLCLPWIATDLRARSLALNTCLLAGSVIALSVPLGAALALLMVRTNLPGRTLAIAITTLMLFLPLHLQAGAWQAGFGAGGWYTLATDADVLIAGWQGAIWIHTVAAIPWVVLITGCGFYMVEPTLEEQALLECRGPLVALRVTAPRSLGAIVAAVLWVGVTCSSEMTVTDLFRIRTYAEELYTQIAVTPDASGAALGMVPAAALTMILVAAGILLAASLVPRTRLAPPVRRVVFRLGGWRVPAAVAVFAVLFVLLGVPLANLIYRAGIEVEQTPLGRLRSWSGAKCLQIMSESLWRFDPATGGSLRPGRFLYEFGWTLGIGTLAATCATALAWPLAWAARQKGFSAVCSLLLVAGVLAVPAPLLGLGLIYCFVGPNLDWLYLVYNQSITAPLIAQTVRALPLATLVLWYTMRTVPIDLLDAAECDGLATWGQWRHVVLPLRWPAVGLAWLASLVTATGELGASYLVAPPRVTLLSVRIWTLLHYGVDDLVAGVYLVLLLFLAMVTAAAMLLARRFLARWQEE